MCEAIQSKVNSSHAAVDGAGAAWEASAERLPGARGSSSVAADGRLWVHL